VGLRKDKKVGSLTKTKSKKRRLKTNLLLKPGNRVLQRKIIDTTFINVRERRRHLNRTVGIVALCVYDENMLLL